MIIEDYFIDRNEKLEAFVKIENTFCVLLLGGRAETKQARALQSFLLVGGLVSTAGRYSYIVDLTKVRYLSSSALALLKKLSEARKRFLIVCGADPVTRAGLVSVGIGDSGNEGGILFFDDISDALEDFNVSARLRRTIESSAASLTEPYKPELAEAAIVSSYIAAGGDKAAAEAMASMSSYIKEAFNSDEIVFPAQNIFAVCAFIYIRRLLKDNNLYSAEDRDGFNAEMIEVIAKELTENAVSWGYDGADGAILMSHNIVDDHLNIYFRDYGLGFRRIKKKRSVFEIGGKGLERLQILLPQRFYLFSPAPILEDRLYGRIAAEAPNSVPGAGVMTIIQFPLTKSD